MPNPRDLPQKHWDLGQQIPNPRDREESPPWQKTRGRGLDSCFDLWRKKNEANTDTCFFWREVSSWTSSILILVMLPIIVRHLLFKLSWRMLVCDLMWSLTCHVPSNDCAHISLLRNESTGLRDDREWFSWWLRCCWYRSSGRNVSGTVSCPVACWLTFSHENSWRQNFGGPEALSPVSTIRQNLKQESHPRKSFKSYTRHMNMNMVSPFRHSLVGYWPSLALDKSSSAFVKREVARLLQFHSHERSYSRPTAKTCPIYCLLCKISITCCPRIGYEVSTPEKSCRLEVVKLSTAKRHHPIKSKFGPCRFDKMM